MSNAAILQINLYIGILAATPGSFLFNIFIISDKSLHRDPRCNLFGINQVVFSLYQINLYIGILAATMAHAALY